MTTIHLHGKLGKKFGKKHSFEVSSVKEIFIALNVNTEGKFFEYLSKENEERTGEYALIVGDKKIETKEDLKILDWPATKEIHLIPVLSGEFWWTVLANVIISIVLAYVSMLLQPSPEINSGNEIRKDSYLFNGGPITARQGMPVPVGYGTMMVYPIIINSEYEYSDMDLNFYAPREGFYNESAFQVFRTSNNSYLSSEIYAQEQKEQQVEQTYEI